MNHRLLVIMGLSVVALTSEAVAQIMIKPPLTSGTVWFFAQRNTTNSTATSGFEADVLRVRHYLYANYGAPYRIINSISNAVIEFDANQTSAGGDFPSPAMTTYNWTGRLNSLSVTGATNLLDPLQVKLYDMKDTEEDGILSLGDLWASLGEPIAVVCNTVPPIGTVYNNLDVTAELRRDLFGPGTGNDTTGFILRGADLGNRARVTFNGLKPFISITVNGSPVPTNLPSTPTPLPPTPNCERLGVWVSMPAHFFWPGSNCGCSISICNPTPQTYPGTPLFVVLDVYGTYFFAPDFEDFSYYVLDIKSGLSSIEVVPEFLWPEGAVPASGIVWYAVMTDPEITEILGSVGSFTFGWGK